ncbi:MAG: histidine kinase [Bacteroidales bacterium]|nr:histidine kinase [Bacteroidales bacterium]
MKTLTFENLLEKKSLLLHLTIILMSFIIAVLFSVLRPGLVTAEDQISLFILLLIQLELFIYVARKIFRRIKPGANREELTKIILSRFALFLVICFIIALIVNMFSITVISLIKDKDPAGAITGFFSQGFGEWLKATIGGLLFGAAIFIFIQWQDALKREQKLREENLIFQNETLKNQVNPHFLFNSLNTISSLIQLQPETAEKFINNLSSVYRYILENGPRDKVALKSELDFIIGYFNLHEVRDEEKIILNIEEIDTGKFEILPVSLQILIENAIKHNIATRENPLRISIYIEGQYIVVNNNLQKKATQLQSMKIGLKNLSERIRLTTGKDLVIEETNNYFVVKLPLLK